MKIFLSKILLVAALFLLNSQVSAEPLYSDVEPPEKLISALSAGGYILYMRHGATTRKSKGKIKVDIDKCETQRNLTVAGLAEVEKIGGIIRSLNIPIADVLSSPYCRTKDTAKATFENYKVDPMLAFSLSKTKAESEVLGQYLFQAMNTSNEKNKNIVFVGHTANLKDGLGVWPKPEGVIVVFRQAQNKVVYKGMIQPKDWLMFE